MVSAVKIWPNFSKLAMNWPIWQPVFDQGKVRLTLSSPTFTLDARNVKFLFISKWHIRKTFQIKKTHGKNKRIQLLVHQNLPKRQS